MLKIRFNEDWEESILVKNNKLSLDKLLKRMSCFREELEWELQDDMILLIIGTNGSGKSTLLQQLFLSALGKYGSVDWDYDNGFDDEDRLILPPDYLRRVDANFGELVSRYYTKTYGDFEREVISQATSVPAYNLLSNHKFYKKDVITDLFLFESLHDYCPVYFDSAVMGSPPAEEMSEGPYPYHTLTPVNHLKWKSGITKSFTEDIRRRRKQKLLFFFDEPENGMDVKSQRRLERILRENMRDGDISLVVTNSICLTYDRLLRVNLDNENPFNIYYEKKRLYIE